MLYEGLKWFNDFAKREGITGSTPCGAGGVRIPLLYVLQTVGEKKDSRG